MSRLSVTKLSFLALFCNALQISLFIFQIEAFCNALQYVQRLKSAKRYVRIQKPNYGHTREIAVNKSEMLLSHSNLIIPKNSKLKIFVFSFFRDLGNCEKKNLTQNTSKALSTNEAFKIFL
jgi:hypothetical protein